MSAAGRRSLKQGSEQTQQAVSDGLDQLEAILNKESAGLVEALEVIGSLQNLFDTAPTTAQAAQAGQIARQALGMIDASRSTSISVATIRGGLKISGLAAETLVGTSHERALDTSSRLTASMIAARAIIQRNSPAGITTVARNLSLSLAVSRNTPEATARANVDFGVRVQQRPDTIGAGMFMPQGSSEFAAWCDTDATCSGQSIIATFIGYVRDAAICLDTATNWKDAVDAHFSDLQNLQAEAVSGIMEVQMDFKAADAPLCDDATECSMDLTIPLNGGITTAGRVAACVRLDQQNDASFRVEVVQEGIALDASDTSLTCTTQALGKHFIATYPSPPSPPPSPPGETVTLPPPTPPSQPVQMAQPDMCTGGSRASVCIKFGHKFSKEESDDFRSRVLTQFGKNVFAQYPDAFTHEGPDACPDYAAVELRYEEGKTLYVPQELEIVPDTVVATYSMSLGADSTEPEAGFLEYRLDGLDLEGVKGLFDDQDLKDMVMDVSSKCPSDSGAARTSPCMLSAALLMPWVFLFTWQ